MATKRLLLSGNQRVKRCWIGIIFQTFRISYPLKQLATEGFECDGVGAAPTSLSRPTGISAARRWSTTSTGWKQLLRLPSIPRPAQYVLIRLILPLANSQHLNLILFWTIIQPLMSRFSPKELIRISTSCGVSPADLTNFLVLRFDYCFFLSKSRSDTPVNLKLHLFAENCIFLLGLLRFANSKTYIWHHHLSILTQSTMAMLWSNMLVHRPPILENWQNAVCVLIVSLYTR